MIWRTLILITLMLGAMAAAKARADDCPGNPSALGTSRVLTVDPREFPRIGTAQYSHSLPLDDKEVVLTFDDGPLPPYTNRVLDVLAEQCVKANYFLVGRMAPRLSRPHPPHPRRRPYRRHPQREPSARFRPRSDGHGEERDRAGHRFRRTVLGKATAAHAFFRIPGSCAARRSKPICSRAA
jgi:hypothetical protein